MSDKREVIEADFTPKLPTPNGDFSWRIKRRSVTDCQHGHLLLDEATRTAKCSQCETSLDLFDTMVRWVNQWQRFADSIAFMKRENDALEQRALALRREANNARAALKRAAPEHPMLHPLYVHKTEATDDA